MIYELTVRRVQGFEPEMCCTYRGKIRPRAVYCDAVTAATISETTFQAADEEMYRALSVGRTQATMTNRDDPCTTGSGGSCRHLRHLSLL